MQEPELESTPGSSLPAGQHASTGSSSEEPLRPAPDLASAQARFTELITEHLDGLYRSALRLTRSRTTAENLVQDVMLKVVRLV